MIKFYNFLKISNNAQRQVARDYAFKSDLKIKWVRPEKISCIRPEKSGDCAKLPPVNPEEILPEFKNSKELETADDVVKSLFLLRNNRGIETSNYHRENLIKEVQRHPLDYGSMEAKLAKMTATIRRFQEHMEQFPKDSKTKVNLKEMIDKRKKFLKYLRRWDYRRFEWILEKLDLVYKPPPSKFHWITRKESLQKLTDEYCDQIKETRLAEYRRSLEAQQISFLEEAVKKMIFVRKEQIEYEVPITVTEEQINETKKQLEELKEQNAASAATSNGNSNEK